MFAGPVDVVFCTELEKQVEFFGEQGFVVFELEAKKRKGFDERSPADDYFCAAATEQIERGEFLEDAHGIGSAEDGDGAGKADSARPRRGGGEDDDGRGVEKIGAMVLTQAKVIEADFIGELDFGQQIGQPLRWINQVSGDGVGRIAREAIDAELHEGL